MRKRRTARVSRGERAGRYPCRPSLTKSLRDGYVVSEGFWHYSLEHGTQLVRFQLSAVGLRVKTEKLPWKTIRELEHGKRHRGVQ
jgi:hypothetical protein